MTTSTIARRRCARLCATAAAVLFTTLQIPAFAQQSMLTPPQQDARLAEIAIDAARRGVITPVPLVGDGSRALGAFYDRFHIGVLIARVQMAAAPSVATIDPAAIVSHAAFQSHGTVVVAYPINCDGEPNRPIAIRVQMAGAQAPFAPTALGDAVRGSAANELLPGAVLPADALVQSFRNMVPIGVSIEVDYDGPACRGAARTTTLALRSIPSRSLATAFAGAKPPSDVTGITLPATVRMQVLLDTTGRVRFPNQVQGPVELGPAAIALLEGRTFEPFTINGTAVPQWTIAPVVFTATGAPAPAESFVPYMARGDVLSRSTTVTVPPGSPPPPPPGPAGPPPPPGQADTQLAQLAIEAAQAGDAVPVPLDPAGPPTHGVLFDRFLIGVVKARAAVAAGMPMNPAEATPALVQGGVIVVAFPLTCDGRTIAPKDLRLSVSLPSQRTMPPRGDLLDRAALAERLPGVRLPEGAIGGAFPSVTPTQNIVVQIEYASAACPGNSNTATLPIQWVRGTNFGRTGSMRLPEGSSLPSPTMVGIRGFIDLEGRFRYVTVADGPPELHAAALKVAATWRYQPYRANGVPLPVSIVTTLAFTTDGLPPTPSSVMPPASGAPPLGATSTTGGRPTTEFTTTDAPGLTAATSSCTIAEDEAYGFTPGNAIKVGGGAREGPARERQYLADLRGPNGQGLSIVRRGSLFAPDRETILDLYEITYAGLAQPLRVYLDEYHADTLKAPKGLVCK